MCLPVCVVESMLKALRLNSEEARLKFPRLLQLVELYPAETLHIMAKEVCVCVRKRVRDTQSGKKGKRDNLEAESLGLNLKIDLDFECSIHQTKAVVC